MRRRTRRLLTGSEMDGARRSTPESSSTEVACTNTIRSRRKKPWNKCSITAHQNCNRLFFLTFIDQHAGAVPARKQQRVAPAHGASAAWKGKRFNSALSGSRFCNAIVASG
jgi:hypothetical protein